MTSFAQLIEEVADQEKHSLSSVILKSKILASHLKSRSFRKWLESELNGYPDYTTVPDYRIVHPQLMGNFHGPFNHRYMNVPLSTVGLPADLREQMDNYRLTGNVASLEAILDSDGITRHNWSISVVELMRHYGTQIDGMIVNHLESLFDRGAVLGVLQNIRTRLLDFLLELREKHPDIDILTTDIQESADVDAAAQRILFQGCSFYGGSGMGDTYNAGQAGAMGPNAKAENLNFVQVLRQGIGEHSLAELAGQLEQLRSAMLSESKNAEQDAAVASVAQAEDAAKKGDAGGVLKGLKAAGSWAGDVATKVGVAIASKAIEKAIGLS